jgi:hypothetical protein
MARPNPLYELRGTDSPFEASKSRAEQRPVAPEVERRAGSDGPLSDMAERFLRFLSRYECTPEPPSPASRAYTVPASPRGPAYEFDKLEQQKQGHGVLFGLRFLKPELPELRRRGLITGSEDAVEITAAGTAWVTDVERVEKAVALKRAEAARVARRDDKELRAHAARRGLLEWLWQQHHADVNLPPVEGVLSTDSAIHEGESLELSDIRKAASHLADENLIRVAASGREGIIRAQITSRGEECVEEYKGDVTKYRKDHPARGWSVQNNSNTFNGEVSGGQVSMGARGDTTQNQYRNEQVAPGYESVAQAVANVLQLLPQMSLQQRDLEDAEAAANEVLEEVQAPSPEPSKLRRGMAALKGAIATGVVTGTSQGAQEIAKTAFDHLNSAAF